jgi:hypothetical protein
MYVQKPMDFLLEAIINVAIPKALGSMVPYSGPRDHMYLD